MRCLDVPLGVVCLTRGAAQLAQQLVGELEDPEDLLSQLPGDADLATDPAVRADVHCKRETGYLDTAYARLAVLQQNWLDAHADLVTEWLALRQRQDTRAQQVLR